jgi:hypothetical protein
MAREYDATEVVESIAVRLWSKHDASSIPEIFTRDATYEDVAWGYTLQGHDGILEYFSKVTAGIPDFVEEIDEVIDVSDGVIVSRWHYSGTFTSPQITKAFRLPGFSVITMTGPLVSSNVDYYGAEDFLAALDHVFPTTEALRDREC